MTQAVLTNSDLTRERRRRSLWLIVLLAVCVPAVLVGTAFSETMSQMLPETLPFPSTYNKKASGTSAMFELCQKLGFSVGRWQRPYRQLTQDKSVKGTLVIILPWEPIAENDVEHLVKWVAAGNDLVFFDFLTYNSGRRLLEKLSLRAKMRTEIKDKEIVADASVAEVRNAKTLRISSEAVLTGGKQIAGTGSDSYLISTTLGKGRCLVGSVPEFCSNKLIADARYKNNFQFLANWFAGSKFPILFDEKCHGYSSGTNVWFFILRSPVGFVLLQLLLIGLVAMVSLNQRFGQAIFVSNARKISNLEFIDGLASTYRRARARDTAWSMMFTPLKAKLCRLLGVAPDAPLEKLAQAWSESSGHTESECREFLERANSALEKRTLSDEELERLIAKADELTADVRALQPTRSVIGA